MRRTPLLAVLAALALATAGVGAAAAPEASFAGNGPETTQNGTVSFTVDVQNTDQATLSVGSEKAGYVLDATVVDDDGDGTVAVTFDASNAGTNNTTLSTADNDAVTIDSETELPAPPQEPTPPLDPGAYRLALSVDGNTSDVDRLYVRQADSTETTTETTSDETTTEAGTETTTDQSSNGDAPGFGVLAALAAVGAAAMLAVRR